MFKYVAAIVVIILCLVVLQKGCERMRNARWDRWDDRRDERHKRRDDRKEDRFWRKEDKKPDDGSSQDQQQNHEREKRIFWRRRES